MRVDDFFLYIICYRFQLKEYCHFLKEPIDDLKSILKFSFIEVQIGLQPGPLICFDTYWFYPEYEDLSSRSTKKRINM